MNARIVRCCCCLCVVSLFLTFQCTVDQFALISNHKILMKTETKAKTKTQNNKNKWNNEIKNKVRRRKKTNIYSICLVGKWVSLAMNLRMCVIYDWNSVNIVKITIAEEEKKKRWSDSERLSVQLRSNWWKWMKRKKKLNDFSWKCLKYFFLTSLFFFFFFSYCCWCCCCLLLSITFV